MIEKLTHPFQYIAGLKSMIIGIACMLATTCIFISTLLFSSCDDSITVDESGFAPDHILT